MTALCQPRRNPVVDRRRGCAQAVPMPRQSSRWTGQPWFSSRSPPSQRPASSALGGRVLQVPTAHKQDRRSPRAGAILPWAEPPGAPNVVQGGLHVPHVGLPLRQRERPSRGRTALVAPRSRRTVQAGTTWALNDLGPVFEGAAGRDRGRAAVLVGVGNDLGGELGLGRVHSRTPLPADGMRGGRLEFRVGQHARSRAD